MTRATAVRREATCYAVTAAPHPSISNASKYYPCSLEKVFGFEVARLFAEKSFIYLVLVIEFGSVDYIYVVFSDPPLTEDDVPTGEWICRRCKVIPASQIEVRMSTFVHVQRKRNP